MERVNWRRVTSPVQLERRFKSLDKNGDGKLDRQEFPEVAARFERLDKNGDGFLTREEIPLVSGQRPAASPTPQPTRPRQGGDGPFMQRLRAMDKNGDGRISREEFTGRPALFDRLDANHDGYLDRSDRRQGPRAAAGKRARPGL